MKKITCAQLFVLSDPWFFFSSYILTSEPIFVDDELLSLIFAVFLTLYIACKLRILSL